MNNLTDQQALNESYEMLLDYKSRSKNSANDRMIARIEIRIRLLKFIISQK